MAVKWADGKTRYDPLQSNTGSGGGSGTGPGASQGDKCSEQCKMQLKAEVGSGNTGSMTGFHDTEAGAIAEWKNDCKEYMANLETSCENKYVIQKKACKKKTTPECQCYPADKKTITTDATGTGYCENYNTAENIYCKFTYSGYERTSGANCESWYSDDPSGWQCTYTYTGSSVKKTGKCKGKMEPN
jgi:hypothetical protein